MFYTSNPGYTSNFVSVTGFAVQRVSSITPYTSNTMSSKIEHNSSIFPITKDATQNVFTVRVSTIQKRGPNKHVSQIIQIPISINAIPDQNNSTVNCKPTQTFLQ